MCYRITVGIWNPTIQLFLQTLYGAVDSKFKKVKFFIFLFFEFEFEKFCYDKFQYLYTCVITRHATVSNIQLFGFQRVKIIGCMAAIQNLDKYLQIMI